MPTILDQIVADKRRELAAAKELVSEADLEQRLFETALPAPRGFRVALEETPFVRVIAEVKRKSPAAGPIRDGVHATDVASAYASAGAACISVLPHGTHFGGSLLDLIAVRTTVDVPLLRKDFILERYQVLEARLAGADAVLLIAEMLGDLTLSNLLRDIHSLGMDALAECYDAENV